VALPPDFLTAVVLGPTVGAILGWLIPFITDSRKKRRQAHDIKTYLPEIDKTYESSMKNKEECLRLLLRKRMDTTRLLEEGTINDLTFQILNDRISKYVDELNNSKAIF
jgi:hypothetical protein